MNSSSNPLLADDELPCFEAIQPEHVLPAVRAAIEANKTDLSNIEQHLPNSWDPLLGRLDMLDQRLAKVWSPIRHLNAVTNSDALRDAYNECLPLLSDYWSQLAQNHPIYAACQRLQANGGQLNRAQQKLLDNTIRDFERGGVALNHNDQKQLASIDKKIAQLSAKFEEQLLDATKAWYKHFECAEELAGLPESSLAAAAQRAEQAGRRGFSLNLEYPSYFAAMSYLEQRALRQEIYTAYTTRASDCGPHAGRWDNLPIMREILALRHRKSQLLGFAHFAAYSLSVKMAATPERVESFLLDLLAKGRQQALAEFAELEAFAGHPLEAWDVLFYSNRLQQSRYQISPEQLKPYFPAPKVVNGMFEIVRRLYGVRIAPCDQPVSSWHPEVSYYQLWGADGELRGGFYVDLYARANKRGGAWMDEYLSRHRHLSGLQRPIAFLTCNLSPPVGAQPALLTHEEVLTLLHEFGHTLHHLLTKVDYAGISGINGVEWDAVELPSQLLENWAWEPAALSLISGHIETGEPLPTALLSSLRASRDFQAGMQLMRQLEFALFDLWLHRDYESDKPTYIADKLTAARAVTSVTPVPAFNRFQNSFSHIFAGGYAAGYYSYKWAEVLAADVFERFLEDGIFNKQTGQAFLKTVLEQGGARSAMELFVQFRGREPRVEPLLKQAGLVN